MAETAEMQMGRNWTLLMIFRKCSLLSITRTIGGNNRRKFSPSGRSTKDRAHTRCRCLIDSREVVNADQATAISVRKFYTKELRSLPASSVKLIVRTSWKDSAPVKNTCSKAPRNFNSDGSSISR